MLSLGGDFLGPGGPPSPALALTITVTVTITVPSLRTPTPPTPGASALPAASPARAPGATMVMDGQLVLQVPDVPGEQGGLVPTAHTLLASQPLGEKPPAEGRLGHL